jgi:hypothetical protein
MSERFDTDGVGVDVQIKKAATNSPGGRAHLGMTSDVKDRLFVYGGVSGVISVLSPGTSNHGMVLFSLFSSACSYAHHYF